MHFAMCLALATFLIPLNNYAQENKDERMRKHMENTTPEERADFQTNRMQEFLTLSDEQTEKVREINLKYAKKKHQKPKAKMENTSLYLKMLLLPCTDISG